LFIYKLRNRHSDGLLVSFSLSINANFEWNLHYLGHPVNIGENSFFADSPERLYTSALIENILKQLDSSKICAGNPDQKFQVLSDNRQGIFNDHAGIVFF